MKWETVSFEDGVSSRGSGSAGLPQSQWEECGQYPVIGQGAELIEGWTNRADLLLTPNPAVVLYGGHTRRAKFVDSPFVPGPNVKILEPKEKLDAKFLFYFLAQLPIESRGYADHFPEVRRSSIPLPPLAEQRRIAEVLDRAEALRAKRRAALAQLDSLTQSLFLDLFGDPVSNPKGVKVVRLADVATRITDGVHQKPNYTESGVPFISVKDITTGKLIFDQCKFISVEDHERFTKRCKPERLDILYTKVGATYGRPAIVETDREFSLYVSVCIIKPRKDLIDPHFLNAALGTSAVKNQADRRIKGIGVPDLHLDQIQSFLIPLPSMSQQREFARRVTAVEALKTAQRASLAELDALFATLQHRAFKGELWKE